MAQNQLPNKFDRLIALAKDMKKGLHDKEVEIGIKQNMEASFAPAITAATNAETAFQDSRVAKKTATATLTVADNAGKVFIGNARLRLVKFFGAAYSAEWAAAGWPESSTGVPATQAERYTLQGSLKNHFDNFPAHASADMDVTEALALAAETAISDARGALQTAVTACGTSKATRDTAVQNLRKKMTGLIAELDQLLGPEDPRWHMFGLSRPADPELPEVPEGLVLTAGTAGHVLADWEDAIRADRYRPWLFIEGVDTEWHAWPVPFYDSDATLDGLTTGATVKVRITAVNEAGESQPSVEQQMVVP